MHEHPGVIGSVIIIQFEVTSACLYFRVPTDTLEDGIHWVVSSPSLNHLESEPNKVSIYVWVLTFEDYEVIKHNKTS